MSSQKGSAGSMRRRRVFPRPPVPRDGCRTGAAPAARHNSRPLTAAGVARPIRVHQPDGLCRRGFTAQGDVGFGARQYLQGNIEQYRQRPEGTGQGPRYIVTGHIFHHLAAKAQVFTLAVQAADTQDEVACGTRIGAPRSGQAAGNGATQRGPGSRSAAVRMPASGFPRPARPRSRPVVCRRAPLSPARSVNNQLRRQ